MVDKPDSIDPICSPTDSEAFEHGLIQLTPTLRAFTLSLCGDRKIAADLVQKTLAKAVRSRATHPRDKDLKAWLYVILRDEFYQHNLSTKRTFERGKIGQAVTQNKGADESHCLGADTLTQGNLSLSPEEQEALILAANEFSIAEAARICGCSVSTIRRRISGARRKLAAPQKASCDRTNDA